MTEFTCIGCPRGCTLRVAGEAPRFEISGNSCPRGEEYAICEMTAPRRMLCTTVRTTLRGVPVLPVRLTEDIPRELIFPAMREINALVIETPLPRGAMILKNLLGTGADVITTAAAPENGGEKETDHERKAV